MCSLQLWCELPQTWFTLHLLWCSRSWMMTSKCSILNKDKFVFWYLMLHHTWWKPARIWNFFITTWCTSPAHLTCCTTVVSRLGPHLKVLTHWLLQWKLMYNASTSIMPIFCRVHFYSALPLILQSSTIGCQHLLLVIPWAFIHWLFHFES